MKAVVLYDSNFGNTKIIADMIASELGKDVKAIPVSDFDEKDLEGVELVVAGSPINGWRPSEKMMQLLAKLVSRKLLKGMKAASFDTRINVFFHGDAARKIASELGKAGAEVIDKPEVFFVKGKAGPLVDGEVEKAKNWAKALK